MAKAPQYHSEKDVKRRIKLLLERHGWMQWMTPANGYGKSGISDISALRGGVFIAIEAKFGKGKPTALQVAYLQAVRAQNAFAFIIRDTNMDWFQSWLEAFDRACEAAKKRERPTPEDGALMINAIREMQMDLPPLLGGHAAQEVQEPAGG